METGQNKNPQEQEGKSEDLSPKTDIGQKAPQVGSESQGLADALQEGLDKAGEEMSNSQYSGSSMGRENMAGIAKESPYEKENEEVKSKYGMPETDNKADNPIRGQGSVGAKEQRNEPVRKDGSANEAYTEMEDEEGSYNRENKDSESNTVIDEE